MNTLDAPSHSFSSITASMEMVLPSESSVVYKTRSSTSRLRVMYMSRARSISPRNFLRKNITRFIINMHYRNQNCILPYCLLYNLWFNQTGFFWLNKRNIIEYICNSIDIHRDTFDNKIKRVYFGHSHVPFSGIKCHELSFYNTGSAIKGLPFNMMSVEV